MLLSHGNAVVSIVATARRSPSRDRFIPDAWIQPFSARRRKDHPSRSQLVSKFVYEPGQVFTFIGDDDVWVYVDGDLVVDIGGLHPTVEATIELDTLGLAPGETHTLDVFHAERCASGSRFRIDTTIECLQDVPVE